MYILAMIASTASAVMVAHGARMVEPLSVLSGRGIPSLHPTQCRRPSGIFRGSESGMERPAAVIRAI